MLGFVTAKVIAIGGGVIIAALAVGLGLTAYRLDKAQTKIERQAIWEEGVVTAVSNASDIRDPDGNRSQISRDSVINQIGYLGDAVTTLKGKIADQNSDIEMRGLILDTQRADARADGQRLDRLAGTSQNQINKLLGIAAAVSANPACRADPELLAALEGL